MDAWITRRGVYLHKLSMLRLADNVNWAVNCNDRNIQSNNLEPLNYFPPLRTPISALCIQKKNDLSVVYNKTICKCYEH